MRPAIEKLGGKIVAAGCPGLEEGEGIWLPSGNRHEPHRIAKRSYQDYAGGGPRRPPLFATAKFMFSANHSPADIAQQIQRALKDGGSSQHAAGVQWFFKEPIKSHGWYTADLRRAVRRCRREILRHHDFDFLVQVADRLFFGCVLEEKVAAVFLLEKMEARFGDREFRMFEAWLDRISCWADHDGLVHYLIAPMVAAKPTRARAVFRWAKSKNRWHRRAACVALIQGTRQKKFLPQVKRLSNALLADQDDMVQKGVGWLLRETAKSDAKHMIPYLIRIRGKAPRLVLRTACETLPGPVKKAILRTAPQK